MALDYKYIRPLLFMFPAEAAHKMALFALKKGLCGGAPSLERNADSDMLISKLWHLKFSNPVGLAAGFDKNGEVITPLFKLGFGAVECGTVTMRPQIGNPKPRIFRAVNEYAVINRMGFPSCGVNIFKENIAHFLSTRPRPQGVLGLNIGMNKDQSEPLKDYKALIQQIGALADYITINISSPNTPGLRNLQEPEHFSALAAGVIEARAKYCGSELLPPILFKLAPDLDGKQQQALAKAALESGIDGLILTNTTLARPDQLPANFAAEKGGLSGRPLKDQSTEIISNFYKLTGGKLPIIGAGGIENASDAYAKIKAGASLVQLYSGLIYHGPLLAAQINTDLIQLLKADGFTHISEAIGIDHKQGA